MVDTELTLDQRGVVRLKHRELPFQSHQYEIGIAKPPAKYCCSLASAQ